MFRRLRVLAAFFMVPVVLFMPNPAHAAEWHSVHLNASSQWLGEDAVPGTFDTVDCSFSLLHRGGYTISLSTGACYGLSDVTWGYTQPGESGHGYTISLEGVTDTGATCSGSSTSSLAQHSKNGTLRVAGTITPGEISTNAEDCSIQEVCITHAAAANFMAMSDCQAVDISPDEEEEPETGTCVHGTPTMKWEWRRTTQHMAGYHTYELWLTFGLRGLEGPSTATWVAGVQGNYARNGLQQISTVETKFTEVTWATEPPPRPVGVEVYAWPDPWQDQMDSNAVLISNTRPTAKGYPFAGWTQPGHCRFWFGSQIVNDGDNTTEDVPAGDGLTDPEPEEPEIPAEPVLEEPPTPVAPADEPSFWGAILALLRTIWGAITAGFSAVVNAVGRVVSALAGIGQTIADAIMGGLEAAFVPSDGYMEAKWNGVATRWDNTSPAKYSDALQSFNVGGVSGCSGMPLNVTLPGGVRINQSIGDACSGTLATAAGVVQAALTAVVGVGGAIACVRAVGSGLGWNPNVGRPGGAA